MGMLYDDDIVIWSETQAALLRRMAAGERVNDALDFANLIEEVEAVGRSQYQGVASQLRVALTHLLLAHGAPGAQWVRHWLIEVRTALGDAERAYSPSIAQRIDLDREWRLARRLAIEKLETIGSTRPLPEACPYTIPELVGPDVEPDALLARLGG